MRSHSPSRVVVLVALAVVLVAGAIAGCSDDKSNPTGPGGGSSFSNFSGIFAGAGASGTVKVSITGTNLAAPFGAHSAAHRAGQVTEVHANATVTPAGDSDIELTGIYDTANDSIYVTGGPGGGYTLIGHYDDSVTPPSITGNLATPTGDATFGCFTGAGVKVYTGTYASTVGSATGSWDFITADTALVGIALPAGGATIDIIYMEGTIARTGTTRAIAITGGTVDLPLTATGNLDTGTNAVSGTWVVDDPSDIYDDNGTWTGALHPLP